MGTLEEIEQLVREIDTFQTAHYSGDSVGSSKTNTNANFWMFLKTSKAKGVGYGGYGRFGLFSRAAEGKDVVLMQKAREEQNRIDLKFAEFLRALKLHISQASENKENSAYAVISRSHGLLFMMNAYLFNSSFDDMATR